MAESFDDDVVLVLLSEDLRKRGRRGGGRKRFMGGKRMEERFGGNGGSLFKREGGEALQETFFDRRGGRSGRGWSEIGVEGEGRFWETGDGRTDISGGGGGRWKRVEGGIGGRVIVPSTIISLT